MESHRYNLDWRKLAGIAGWPLLFLAVFALVIHGMAALRLLPSSLPILDVDRTILLHQAAASERATGASTILVGDSSCLMDVSAPLLQEELGPGERVINLGAISYLDLESFGMLVSKYLEANPATVNRVVLLMHPEALRLRERNEYFRNVLESAWNADHSPDRSTPPLVSWTGGETLRTRVLTRWIPTPLPGQWGAYYGFSRDLWQHLEEHNGSAVDPRSFSLAEAKGNAEYRLAPELEKASQTFRQVIPPHVQLVVGITPAPSGFVLPGHDATCVQMLEQWAKWLQADQTLTTLPCALPDEMFASITHLNPEGSRHYTSLLARELRANDNPSQIAP